jgi:hypothetical protein
MKVEDMQNELFMAHAKFQPSQLDYEKGDVDCEY